MVKYKINYKVGMVINTKGIGKYSNFISMGYGDYWTHSLWVREVTQDKLYIQEADGIKEKKIVSHWVDKVYFDELFAQNLIKVMDFGLNKNQDKFQHFCNSIENIKYDYFSVIQLAIMRLLTILGVSDKLKNKIVRNKKLSKSLKKLNIEYQSVKKLDCSEMIAFGINHLTDINVNEELKLNLDPKTKNVWDYVRPQHISILYDSINTDKIRLIDELELMNSIKEIIEEEKILNKNKTLEEELKGDDEKL